MCVSQCHFERSEAISIPIPEIATPAQKRRARDDLKSVKNIHSMYYWLLVPGDELTKAIKEFFTFSNVSSFTVFLVTDFFDR